jgi:hypothetical protein
VAHERARSRPEAAQAKKINFRQPERTRGSVSQGQAHSSKRPPR